MSDNFSDVRAGAALAWAPLPDAMPDGRPWPRISIVTPSYNQGRYLEETIRSILAQGYPNLEYIVIDGGSTDESVEIIRKYEPHLAYWVSEPDGGQVDAINKGLGRVTGDWFNWINSDDVLLPNALRALAYIAGAAPQARWISGCAMFLTASGENFAPHAPWRKTPSVLALGLPWLAQDATFVRKDLIAEGPPLRPDLSNVFDTVYYWSLLKIEQPLLTTSVFSGMRIHPDQKTKNVMNRRHERDRWITPFHNRLPAGLRLLDRLNQSRLKWLGGGLLKALVHGGLTRASRDWRAAVYDKSDYQWRIVPARRMVFY